MCRIVTLDEGEWGEGVRWGGAGHLSVHLYTVLAAPRVQAAVAGFEGASPANSTLNCIHHSPTRIAID